MKLIDTLSCRGIQYGIYPDGTLRVFAGERRLAVTEKTLNLVEAAYRESMAKLDRGEVEKIRSDQAGDSIKRKLAGHRAYLSRPDRRLMRDPSNYRST